MVARTPKIKNRTPEEKYQVIDFEATGLRPYHGDIIFAFCIGHWNGDVEVWRLDGKDGKDPKQAERRLRRFIDDTSIVKIAHNYKYELAISKVSGFPFPDDTIWHDTMLMSQELQNDKPSHALDYLCWELCGYTRELDSMSRKMGKEYGGYQNIPVEHMNRYQFADGERGMLLFRLFWPELQKDEKLCKDYLNEIELIRTTQAMEERGIMMHRQNTEKLLRWLEDEVDRAQKDVYVETGRFVNLGSNPQIHNLLFNQLKMPVLKLDEDTGNISADKDVILELRESHPHPVLEILLRHRSYVKGRGIIKGYMKTADENDIVHSELKTNHNVTGRQASENPNLQNVSKQKVLKNPYPVKSRMCWRPRPGYIFLLVDYSGLQMRLIIDAVKEKELMKILEIGGDVHLPATQIFWGDEFDKEQDKDVKSTLRSASKNGQFGIGFGAGAATLAKTLNQPFERALNGFTVYCDTFQNVANFTNMMSELVRKDGQVTTAFGRHLRVNVNKAYMGANYRIQGDEAGILKRAENRVHRFNQKEVGDLRHLLLPVHDELVIEYPRTQLKHLREYTEKVGKLMTSIDEIETRLDVEWKSATTNWNDAKGLKICA